MSNDTSTIIYILILIIWVILRLMGSVLAEPLWVVMMVILLTRLWRTIKNKES